MKRLIFLFLVSSSVFAQGFDLQGTWQTDSNSVDFIEVDGTLYTQTTERFVFPDGELSHTIQQSFKIPQSTAGIQTGTVDIFDSRGCSFKDLEVKLQFQSSDEVNFLVTYPRYKIVTITTGPTNG